MLFFSWEQLQYLPIYLSSLNFAQGWSYELSGGAFWMPSNGFSVRSVLIFDCFSCLTKEIFPLNFTCDVLSESESR
jgi:hypothetical protein